MNEVKNDKREYPICKYCRDFIRDGKIYEKDAHGNGFHNVCYLKVLEYYSSLLQSDISEGN